MLRDTMGRSEFRSGLCVKCIHHLYRVSVSADKVGKKYLFPDHPAKTLAGEVLLLLAAPQRGLNSLQRFRICTGCTLKAARDSYHYLN